jgi:hypothetical protein
MAVEPRCMAGLAKADPRLTRPAVLWAAGLFLAGLIFLLFPVGSTKSYDGKFTATGDSGWELCGLGVTEAFVTPNGADDPRREQKMDCAAKARSQLGWGLLFLVLAVPPGFIALATAPGPIDAKRFGDPQEPAEAPTTTALA